MENESTNEVTHKTKKQKTRRARGFTTSVHLGGEVGRWCAQEAKVNYRTIEGQIAYCVAKVMADGK
jgi:hypothetical protein